jgi:isoleucyl-tRNA synthetase
MGCPEYTGKRVWEANQPIIDLLKSAALCCTRKRLEHSYPHCWRCHNPVIFRATEQWFISMETPMPGGKSKEDTFAPARSKKSSSEVGSGVGRRAALEHDRDAPGLVHLAAAGVGRAHRGVSLRSCGKPLNDHAVNRKVVELFSALAPTRGLHPSPTRFFLRERSARTAGHADSKRKPTSSTCGWNPARAIWRSSMMSRSYPWPSDLYLEGGDQYRGWFQSSLLCAMGTHGTPPYKGVVTPGWTLDEKGQAMSKSRGNDVDPVDIAGSPGRRNRAALGLRRSISRRRGRLRTLMLRIAENYRKIRKTFLHPGQSLRFRSADDAVPFRKHGSARPVHAAPDLRFRLRRAQTGTRSSLSTRFITAESFLHRRPERVLLRCAQRPALHLRAKVAARRSAQTAIWRIGEALVRLLAPIMSFTSEEVWIICRRLWDATKACIWRCFLRQRTFWAIASHATKRGQRRTGEDWTTLRRARRGSQGA